MATRQTNMRLDVELIEKYKALGRENDRDASYYMRKALEQYVGGKTKAAATTLAAPKKEVVQAKKAFDPIDDCVLSGINVSSWAEWCDYRKSKRKPVSAMAANKQLKFLRAYENDSQKAIIDLSIANDYAGLFPPKSNPSGKQTNDAINDTSWASELGDITGQQDNGAANSQFPGVEELAAGSGQRRPLSSGLQAAASGGDEGEQRQLGLNGECWNG